MPRGTGAAVRGKRPGPGRPPEIASEARRGRGRSRRGRAGLRHHSTSSEESASNEEEVSGWGQGWEEGGRVGVETVGLFRNPDI